VRETGKTGGYEGMKERDSFAVERGKQLKIIGTEAYTWIV